ncbi:MAG: hypothetical protein ACI8W8_002561 [Rhodothermales bacterium]|jgi:hypothetical protein
MAKKAIVVSVPALEHFRTRLAAFRSEASMALGEAQGSVQNTTWWLHYDRLPHWKQEARRRADRVADARNDMHGARLLESREAIMRARRDLEVAEERMAEAERKLRAINHWQNALDSSMRPMVTECQRLARLVEQDLPRGIAELDAMLLSLDKYAAVGTAGKRDPEDSE